MPGTYKKKAIYTFRNVIEFCQKVYKYVDFASKHLDLTNNCYSRYAEIPLRQSSFEHNTYNNFQHTYVPFPPTGATYWN